MKELPKVFHNKIDKKFDNNRSVFYSNNTYEEDRRKLNQLKNMLKEFE